MHKYIIISLIALISIGQLTAQSQETVRLETVRPYRIGLSLGNSFTGYREETYSPLNMYLNTLTFIIDGNIERGLFLHSLNMGFFMGKPETANPASAVMSKNIDHQTGEAYYFANAYFRHDLAVRAYIGYALDYRLWGNDTFPGYLGGAFRADAYMQFANYPSITGLVSLGLHATQKWIINPENSFVFSIGIPVLGYALRPPFAGADAALLKYAEENPMRLITLGNIVSLHNYCAIFGDLKYHHKINSLLSLYSGLGFELSRINIPRPRIDTIFRLNTGIAFTF
jgi:hypothetical protein